VIKYYDHDDVDVFHTTYKGPTYNIQCAVCGLI